MSVVTLMFTLVGLAFNLLFTVTFTYVSYHFYRVMRAQVWPLWGPSGDWCRLMLTLVNVTFILVVFITSLVWLNLVNRVL